MSPLGRFNPQTAQLTVQSRRKIKYEGKIPDLEDTPESKQLLKLEKQLSRNLLAILNYIVKNEFCNTNQQQQQQQQKPNISTLKRKYGVLILVHFQSINRGNL